MQAVWKGNNYFNTLIFSLIFLVTLNTWRFKVRKCIQQKELVTKKVTDCSSSKLFTFDKF